MSNLVKNLAAVLIAILVCFGSLEIGFRLYFHNALDSYDKYRNIHLLPESGRVYGLQPKLPPPVKTNSLGFRGEEFTQTKPENTYRILMLGDSVIFGTGVDWDETVPYYLQSTLNANNKGLNIEVINLGIAGYNTSQEVATLREVGLALSPDLILLNICLNDSDPVKQVTKAGLRNTAEIGSIWDINLRTLVDSSYFLTFVKHQLLGALDESSYLYRALNSPDLFINNRVGETGWKIMKQDMETLLEITQKNNIPLGAIIYPYNSQIEERDDKHLPQIDLEAFWKTRQIPALNPIDVYRNAEQDMFSDSAVHLSPYGAARVADAISEFLTTSGFLPANKTASDREPRNLGLR